MIIMCDTLEEDIGLSDRILIMKDGRFVREVKLSTLSETESRRGDRLNRIRSIPARKEK